MSSPRERLDHALVSRGLAPSRSRARDLVRRGAVFVAGTVETRPAAPVGREADIRVAREAGAFRVSRGALKLEAALAAFGFHPAGQTALDIGAAAGGFTEVLLERGAAKVYSVDVGRDQLHQRLKTDRRVVSLEGQDARTLDAALVPDAVEAIVADVSFISLTKALPAALRLAAPGAWLAALVKPQFESGAGDIGKGGLVRDPSVQAAAVARVKSWLESQPGWRVAGVIPSPVAGGSGNREFLIGARRNS